MLAAMSAASAAETTSSGVPLPGLEADTPESVTPHSASVSLRGGKVSLELTVSATPEANALLLKGLQFGWLGATERYPDRQFPELIIHLNGELLVPRERFEAMTGGTNITSWLRDAGMDPWAITRNPPVTTAHPSNPQMLNGLRKLGAIADAGFTEEKRPLYTAKWVARRLLTIPVAPGARATLQLDYDARPGISETGGDLRTGSFDRLYCLSEKNLHGLQSSGAKRPVTVSEFAIATGIDGKPPDSVTLSWRASQSVPPTRLSKIFWCGAGSKPMEANWTANRERASVDTSGVLHVLMIAP